MSKRREVTVRSTNGGLRYIDGRFDSVLEPGGTSCPARRCGGAGAGPGPVRGEASAVNSVVPRR